jgi:hypothetical protein
MLQPILNRSRSDKFLLILDLPPALKGKQDSTLQSGYNPDQIQFTVYGSPVPKITIPEIEIPFGGQFIKVSSGSRPSFPSLDIKFLIDNGYQNYWTLWNWLNLFNDSREGTSDLNANLNHRDKNIFLTNPLSKYTSNFSLYALDEFDKKIISFDYTNAFITGLSEINYSYQEPSEITCNATFVYNQLQVNLLKDVNVSSC